MKSVLIIKTGRTVKSVPREAGDFEHWIMKGLGLPPPRVITRAVFTGEGLPARASVGGVVITGSPAMVTDRAPWSEQAGDYALEAAEQGVPVLGICYGHQLIAQALGGEVGYHPRGREIGTTGVSLTPEAADDPLFRNLPAHFPAHVTHSQSVLRLPAGASVLAANDFDAYQGARFGEKLWGIQFHPEFNAAVMRAYINDRAAALMEEGADPGALLEAVREAPDAERVLRNFAALVDI